MKLHILAMNLESQLIDSGHAIDPLDPAISYDSWAWSFFKTFQNIFQTIFWMKMWGGGGLKVM